MVMIYKYIDNKIAAGVIYGLVYIAALAFTFALVYGSNSGGTIAVRRFEKGKEFDGEKFYSEVWTNPVYHFSSSFYGMITSLLYFKFR